MSHSTAKKQSSYFKKTQSVDRSVNSAPRTTINPHRHPYFRNFDSLMCPSVGTVPKKAKPLNKLRPDECGSPFAVRVLAFLTTSLSAWRSVVPIS